jgi:hypothetical protein
MSDNLKRCSYEDDNGCCERTSEKPLCKDVVICTGETIYVDKATHRDFLPDEGILTQE